MQILSTVSGGVLDHAIASASSIRERVDQEGVVLFRAGTRDDFVKLAKKVGPSIPHRDADEDDVTEVKFVPDLAGQAGYDGLSAGPLDPHTDGSGNSIAPSYVALWCAEQAGYGGESVLVDIREVVSDLQREAPWVIETLAQPGIAIFRSGADAYSGPVLFKEQGQWRVRLRLDSQGFFNGDGQRAIQRIREAIGRRAKTFVMQPGEGYIIDNHRILHGRLPFSGSRRMLRVLMS